MRGGGDGHVTTGASRRDRLDRIDWTLRIRHRILARRQILLATVDVAHRAIAPVTRRSLRAHGGKTNFAVVIVAPTETHNRKVPSVCLQVLTGVDPMHQE